MVVVVRVFMSVFMFMLMAVFVRVGDVIVRMFVLMDMRMSMGVLMRVFVVSFHFSSPFVKIDL